MSHFTRSIPAVAAMDDMYAGGSLGALFSGQKFDAALGFLHRKSALRLDGITIQTLKNIPDVAKTWLLRWFNDIWVTRIFPRPGELHEFVVILKGEKSLSALGSYRPVSLLSYVVQLFERHIPYRVR